MPDHLGEFEMLILLALVRLEADAWGVAIRQEIERRTGREIAAGAVYTALGRLQSRGFVASREGETAAGRGGRPRRYYRLEPAGVEALRRGYGAMQQMARGLSARLEALGVAGRTR